jgi:hypothetical protein
MAAKYGSASVFYLLGGRSLLGVNARTVGYTVASLHDDITGVGDSIIKTVPTGVQQASIEHGGAFFDTTSLHDVLRDVADSAQETSDVLCAGFGGDTLGQPFVGFGGVYKAEYEPIAEIGKLTKANTKFALNGQVDQGVILHPLAARTTDTNGTTVDQSAGTSAGGVGYVQCTAFSGFSGVVVTIEHSTDGSSWATLLTFATLAAAPGAERKAVSGTVNRYVRAVIDVTGSGSITVWVGFKRN